MIIILIIERPWIFPHSSSSSCFYNNLQLGQRNGMNNCGGTNDNKRKNVGTWPETKKKLVLSVILKKLWSNRPHAFSTFLLQIGVQPKIITELNICWKENFVDINKKWKIIILVKYLHWRTKVWERRTCKVEQPIIFKY